MASTSIPIILEEEGVSAKDFQSVLQDLAVLTPTAHDINQALQSEKVFAKDLAVRLVEKSGLDAVVTLFPENFSNLKIDAMSPEQLRERLDSRPSPVSEVRLLDITASYHQILNKVEKEMAETIRSGHFILGPNFQLPRTMELLGILDVEIVNPK